MLIPCILDVYDHLFPLHNPGPAFDVFEMSKLRRFGSKGRIKWAGQVNKTRPFLMHLETNLVSCCKPSYMTQRAVPSPTLAVCEAVSGTESSSRHARTGRRFSGLPRPNPCSLSSDNGQSMESTTADTTVLTVKRATTLIVSLLVTLCSGTNYVCDPISYAHPRYELKVLKTFRFTPVRFTDR